MEVILTNSIIATTCIGSPKSTHVFGDSLEELKEPEGYYTHGCEILQRMNIEQDCCYCLVTKYVWLPATP